MAKKDYELQRRLEKTQQAGTHPDQNQLFEYLENPKQEPKPLPNTQDIPGMVYLGQIGIIRDELQVKRNEYCNFDVHLGAFYRDDDEIKLILNKKTVLARLKLSNGSKNLVEMLSEAEEIENRTNIDFSSARTAKRNFVSGRELTANGLLVPMSHEENYIKLARKTL